jgi:hypothetical protein
MKIQPILLLCLAALADTSSLSAQKTAPQICHLTAGVGVDTTRGCGLQDPLPDLASISATVGKVLNFDYTTDPYSFVSAALSFSDNALKQKVSFSPLKLTRDPTRWDALSLSATNANSTSTFSFGAGYDWVAHYSSRRQRVYEDIRREVLPNLPVITPLDGESEAALLKRTQQIHDAFLSDYWERRFRNTWALTGNAFVQTFSSLSATKVDLDNDQKIDNAYSTKAYGGSVQALYRWNMRTALSVSGQLGRRRVDSVEGSRLRPFQGASVTFTRLAMILDTAYLSSKDYRSKLYIPSLTAGTSLEWQRCRGAPLECDNRVREQLVLTPFLDIRLPGGAQFRLGLPIRRDRVGDKTGTRVEGVAQFGWAMSSL